MHCPLCSSLLTESSTLPSFVSLREAVSTGLLPVDLPSLLRFLSTHADQYPPHYVRRAGRKVRVLMLPEIHRLQRALITP